MEKKKLTFKELRKLIKEAYNFLKEEDEDVFDDEDSNDSEEFSDVETFSNQSDSIPGEENLGFSNASAKINQLSKKISEDALIDLNEMIEKAKTTGRINGNFNFNKMSSGEKILHFNYVTTVLATLFHDSNTSDNEKKNIRQVLMSAMGVPYETTSYEKGEGGDRPSMLSRIVAKRAKIYNLSEKAKTIDGSYLKDIIADSIYEAIDYAINNFKPERGGEFPIFVIVKATGLTMSSAHSKSAKTAISTGFGGRNFIKSSSIDDPLGNSDEESDSTKADRFTGEEGQKSTVQKESAKELRDVINTFIEARLSKNIEDGAIPEDSLTVYKMLSTGSNLSEIADSLGRTDGSVRQLKGRLQDIITAYVQNGSFQRFIKSKTGIKVNFPNNEFAIAVQGVGETGEEKENSLEYFEQTGIDAGTGEPKGEWVPIKIAKDDDDDSGSFDWNIGDVALKGDAETRRQKGSVSPYDHTLTESYIANEIMKRVNKRILKELGK